MKEENIEIKLRDHGETDGKAAADRRKKNDRLSKVPEVTGHEAKRISNNYVGDLFSKYRNTDAMGDS